MNRYIKAAIVLGLLLVPTLLMSQGLPKWSGTLYGIADYTGAQFSSANPFPVKFATGTGPGGTGGASGTPNEVPVTCNATTTVLLAANAASQFIRIAVPPGAVVVGFNWAGAAATLAPPSDMLSAGQSMTWSPLNGYVPTSQLSCIATTGTQAVTLIYK
jgi:hypothetical protein